MNPLLELAKAMGPMAWRALSSGRLFKPPAVLDPPHPDVDAAWEVHIPTRDGAVLTANVFRSRAALAAGAPRPVVMCAHPYDNRNVPALGRTPFGGVPVQYRLIPQVGHPRFSTQTSWESPDPNYWIPNGYSVVNLNLPGYGGSGGVPSVFEPEQAAAFFDAIEWVGEQPWCTGAVGLSGVSFLAISQYYVAACSARGGGAPKALKAIAPWEGFSDMYRDFMRTGGVQEVGFPPFWWFMEVKPSLTGTPADFLAREGATPQEWDARHPLLDDFWRAKLPSLDRIDVPMLVCASFSDQGLHTDGSLRAFDRSRGPKWLYTHRTGKWASFYSNEVKALHKQFFDCFLKGEGENGFLARAPVRLEVRSDRDTIHSVREEREWPLARTEWVKLFLDGNARALRSAPVADHHELVVPNFAARTCFDLTFDRDTELTGPMVLQLDLELRTHGAGTPPDEAIVFAAVEKRAGGQAVHFHGSVGNALDAVTRGCLAASHRELDVAASRPWLPVLAHQQRLPVTPGDVLRLTIAMSASSTFFKAGEGLRLVLSGSPIIPSPPYRKDASANRGQHVLHLGGELGAYLLVPSIPVSPTPGAKP